MIGETIRDFEIQSEIGSGGYGIVYRAHDTSVDRDVAIKVILPQYANQPEFIDNFAAEARLVAALEHPRIVPLYSYWHDEKGAFLVMRFVRGGSLRGVLARQGALALNKVLRLVEQIADALNAAHESGVVHRDLKPDNILIDERGNAYLTDFGIAKQLSDENASATDSIKGTFAYLSPEQIQQTPVSAATDIYALGIMLYEMLTGQHPFRDTPIAMMVMKHLQEALPDVSDARPDLDGDLDDIIQRATAKDPADRYASTLDLVADLKNAIIGTGPALSEHIHTPPVKKKPTTTEERNRFAMLENVRKFWVEGVLENSLHEAAMIDLGMKSESGAVDNPWDTLIRTASGEEILTDEDIISVFDRMNGKLLILGDPGSGKTTTLLTLARDLLFRAEVDDQHPIPVVFNLSSWSENQPPLVEWLVEELNGKYQVPRKVGQKWVEDDELLLLLDGLDEVAEDVRDACVDAINAYRSEHGFVDVVVCSRITDYDALTGQLKLNGAIVIQPLDEVQIVEYIDALGPGVTVVRDLIARDVQLRELARTPLMLSIMVLAYRGKTASDVPDFDDVDTQRHHLFEVYVNRMFDRRIGEKPYTQQKTCHYLQWLAGRMQQHSDSVFKIEDLRSNWLGSDADRNTYTVVARSFWIFGTVVGTIPLMIATILNLPVDSKVFVIGTLLWAVSAGWLWTASHTVARHFSLYLVPAFFLTGGIMLSWEGSKDVAVVASLASTSTTLGLAAYAVSLVNMAIGNGIQDFKIPELISYNVLAIRPIALIIAVVVAILTGINQKFLFAPDANPTQTLFIAIMALPPAVLFFAIITTVGNAPIDLRTEPNAGIRRAPMVGLRVTSAIAAGYAGIMFAGTPIALQVAIINTLGFGLSTLIIGFLCYGGSVVFQHYLIRYFLHRDGNIPRNLAQFLDYASSLILMRKVGGSYIFIHRYLLEYFAGLSTRPGDGK